MEIVQLPDLLSNKIAAGEVVERPASVVKELIENSIDANSTSIKLDITEAGLQEIKITDDGDGMSEEDCEKAFLRHATSKIKREADLFHVKTLGFRGEALASIASVSRLTIKTSQGDSAGTILKLSGGKVEERGKSDARKGTEITVRDLFFNTPARLKYMKTIHTELGHITDLLNRLAMSHPKIRFEATHNGKPLFKTPGTGDMLQVIAQIYGMRVAKMMLPIQAETLDFSISGYVAKPEITRASRHYISTIVNGRYIKSYPLTQAIIRAYHTLLPIGRLPVAAISITMDPVLVDVNVHPTKLEVRFSKGKELFQTIEETIRSTFRQTTLIPELSKKEENPSRKSEQHTMTFDVDKGQQDNQVNHLGNEHSSGTERNQMNPGLNQGWDVPLYTDHTVREPTEQMDPSFPEETSSMDQVEVETPQNPRVPIIYPIGQLQGTYILGQNENGLYMIDQHAAQERIKYEFFKEKLGKTVNESQELLVPLTFEFTNQETIFIERYKDTFAEVGIFFEPFGHGTYMIRSYPTWFPEGLEEEIIRDMIEQVIRDGVIRIENIREDAAILMSCKRSIKANHYLNEDDMFQLLEKLRTTTDPFTCPHGRPIIVHFSSYELEKMFKRVM